MRRFSGAAQRDLDDFITEAMEKLSRLLLEAGGLLARAAPGRAGFREVAPKTVSDVVSGPVTADWHSTGLPDRQATESELHQKFHQLVRQKTKVRPADLLKQPVVVGGRSARVAALDEGRDPTV